MPGRPKRFGTTTATLLLAAVLPALACERGAPPEEESAAPAEPGPRDALTADDLGDLDRSQVGLTLPWMAGSLNRDAEPGERLVVLEAVEVREGEGFDRMVYRFADSTALPGYRVAYAEGEVRQCGSGDVVPVEAGAALMVRFSPAHAHDESGAATVAERDRTPGLPALRSLRLVCDFEGMVEWVAGVDTTTTYRVLEMRRPARLVVDVRHREGATGGP